MEAVLLDWANIYNYILESQGAVAFNKLQCFTNCIICFRSLNNFERHSSRNRQAMPSHNASVKIIMIERLKRKMHIEKLR